MLLLRLLRVALLAWLTGAAFLLGWASAAQHREGFEDRIQRNSDSQVAADWISVGLQFLGVGTVGYLAFAAGRVRQEVREVKEAVGVLDLKVDGLSEKVAELRGARRGPVWGS